jgi:hypothetical protein
VQSRAASARGSWRSSSGAAAVRQRVRAGADGAAGARSRVVAGSYPPMVLTGRTTMTPAHATWRRSSLWVATRRSSPTGRSPVSWLADDRLRRDLIPGALRRTRKDRLLLFGLQCAVLVVGLGIMAMAGGNLLGIALVFTFAFVVFVIYGRRLQRRLRR